MWEAFKDWIFSIIQFFYNFCGDWGLAIIIITVIFRICVAPLMHQSAKSSYYMQKLQPEVAKIQQRYANDPIRQQQEMQKVMATAKSNPIMGCLPVFLQMPIFMALFQVLTYDMPAHIGDISSFTFYNIIPNLVLTPGSALSEGFGTFVPYLIVLLLFATLTFVPAIIMQWGNRNKPGNQFKQMLAISGGMSVMMLFIGWSSPAGVLLFWSTSSLIAVIQQRISQHLVRAKDEREQAEENAAPKKVKPSEIDVERKVKKPKPKKKR